MMAKWEGIEEFLAVATASSFVRAARTLNVSPTHISRTIMALEQRLQTQLFFRTTRTVRLTDTGRVFQEHCQRIAQETDEAIALISEQGEPQGRLRLTCSTAMGEQFVAPLVRRLMMEHPNLSVSIELSNHVVDLVEEGFDLAIRTGVVSDPRLIATQIASRKLYTCAAPDYLARCGRPHSVIDLDTHERITGSSSLWHFKVDDQPIDHHPSGRFLCNSGHAVIEACVAGIGICQLPDFYVIPHLRHGMVELLLHDMQPDEEPIWAVYPRRRHRVPKILYVVDRLRRELGNIMNPIGATS